MTIINSKIISIKKIVLKCPRFKAADIEEPPDCAEPVGDAYMTTATLLPLHTDTLSV